jgi:hypothetical protein
MRARIAQSGPQMRARIAQSGPPSRLFLRDFLRNFLRDSSGSPCALGGWPC